MAYYKSDRDFTDLVHSKVALEEIYSNLGWDVYDIDPDELEKIDIENGIDYVFTDSEMQEIYVQERFRESKYATYNDVTLRYRRDNNKDISRHESEFYKIEADFLVYGIINKSKTCALREPDGLTFLKFAVIDLKVLYRHIENGDIVFKNTIRTPYVSGNKMYVPINDNVDYSSSFVAFDVKGLNELFGDEDIVVYQKGYF